MKEERFQDRVAIVTGGSSGIGQATCVALAAEGARVVVVGRTPSHVEETLARIDALPGSDPAGRVGLTLDVRSEPRMEAMQRCTLEQFGRIDILVASAGISSTTSRTAKRGSAVAALPANAWDEIIETNLTGMFLANRAVLPAMIRQRSGEILNVSSSLGTASGWAYASAYCASKFGVMGLSEALAEEVRNYGVRVQVLVPDAVDTPMLQSSHLAVMGSLSAEETAEFILHMLSRETDMVLANPLIEPFGTWQKTGHRKAFGA